MRANSMSGITKTVDFYNHIQLKETSNDMIGYSQVYLHAIRLKFQTVNATVLVKS